MPPRRHATCQICDETESKYACPKCAVLYCSVACYKQHKSYSCSAAEPFFDTRTAQIGSAAAARDDDGDDSQAKGKLTAVSVPVPRLLASNEGAASAPGSSSHVRRGDGLGVIAGGSLMGAEAGNAETREIDTRGDGDAVGNDSDPDPIPTPTPNPSQSMSLHLETPRPLRRLASLKWPYVPDASSYPDPLTRDDPKPLSLAQYEATARSPAVRRALAAHPHLPALLRALDALRGPAREAAVQRVLGVAPSQPSFALAGVFSAVPHASPPPSPYNNHGRTGRGAEVEVGADEEDVRALRALAEAVEGAVRSPASAGAGDGRSGVDPLGLDWEEMEA